MKHNKFAASHNGEESRKEQASALLRDARYRAGLTQTQVADQAGISRPLVSEYERGKKDPSVTMLARLIDACGMELRLEAAELSDTDRKQYLRDAAIGERMGHIYAQRLRDAVQVIREPSAEELAFLKSGIHEAL